MTPLIILGAFIIVGAIVLIIIGIRNPMGEDESILQSRLEDLSQKGVQVNLEKLELSQPFTERIIYPLARKLGEVAIKFTPQNALNSISRKLELAGSPPQLDPTLFLSLQFFGAVGFGGAVFTFK
jgi:tight adherence protein C